MLAPQILDERLSMQSFLDAVFRVPLLAYAFDDVPPPVELPIFVEEILAYSGFKS